MSKITTCNLLLEYYTHKCDVKLWDKYVNKNSEREIPDSVFDEFFEIAQYWEYKNNSVYDIRTEKEVIFNYTDFTKGLEVL